MHRCVKCNKVKENDEFDKNRSTKSGLSSYCKKCRVDIRHAEYIKHKTHIDARNTQYYRNHLTQKKQYDKVKHKERSLRESQYCNGVLNKDTNTGIGLLTENVVSTVLGDCVNLNAVEFHSKYDLLSVKYGNINVKSSMETFDKRCKGSRWGFRCKSPSLIPDYYVCIGFDKDRLDIKHVWVICGSSDAVKRWGMDIANSDTGLLKYRQYEVDPTPYNEIYQNLDIHTLPEFRNLKCDVGGKQ